MKITKIQVKNFGKFHNKTMELKSGINLVYGDNESGKTTLHTFLKGIFFGIRKLRGRGSGSKTDTYGHYEPWENASYYAGTVWFACGEKEFRLERDFNRLSPKAELVCETDGECLSIQEGDLSMLMGNISEVVYDNTISIGQLKSQTEGGLVTELRNYMANYQGSNDCDLNLIAARNYLVEKRKAQEAQLAQEEERKEQLKREIHSKIDYIIEETENLRQNIKEQESEYERVWRLEKRKRYVKKQNVQNRRWAVSRIAAIAVALLTCFGDFIVQSRIERTVMTVAAILIVAAILFWGRDKKRMDRPGGDSYTDENDNSEKIRWNIDSLKKSLREKEILLENYQQEYRDYSEDSPLIAKLQTEQEAITLAMNTMKEISTNMQERAGQEIQLRTSRILQELTEGKYGKIQIDADFQMSLDTGEHYVNIEQLSRGTIEQIYFSLRMAVSEILCKEEPLPILLDDVFAMYDDRRLGQVLKWLANQKRQVVLFTCHHREEELLDKMGIQVNKIHI